MKIGRVQIQDVTSADELAAQRDIAVRQLLDAAAGLLVPVGLTPKRFGQLAKLAFVHFAASNAKLRNGKINHSRVAALTGLTRYEVKRLLTADTALPDSRNQRDSPIDRVVTGWLTDARFLTASGAPKRISIEGHGSFAELVRRCAGDVTHRAVLEELKRIGAVTVSVSSRYVALSPDYRTVWRRLAAKFHSAMPSLIEGVQMAVQAATKNQRVVVRRLQLRARSPVEMSLLRERVDLATQALFDGLKNSLDFAENNAKHRSEYALTLRLLVVAGPSGVDKRDRWDTPASRYSSSRRRQPIPLRRLGPNK